MKYLAIINADWGNNISTIINAPNQITAYQIAEKIKDNYGDSQLKSIICSVEKV